MQIPGTLPRRLRAVAVLAAVFASGWYLGQPLGSAWCAAGRGPHAQPLRYGGHLEAEAVFSCGPGTYRLPAWLSGDFR